MDQVKAALAWIRAHHFWLLTLAVIGVGLGAWYTSTSSLAEQYRSNHGKIKGEFDSINNLKNAPFKPNELVNNGQRLETIEQAKVTLELWKGLYANQKENVLIWPEELGPRFIRAVQDQTFGDKIKVDFRELYLTYVENTFPNLLKIVDAELYSVDSAQSTLDRLTADEDEEGDEELETYLVEWVDQENVRKRLDLEKIPSSVHIWVLQEDLWVYRTILQAIANTNTASGATRSDRAAVQVIQELLIGSGAAEDNSKADRLVPPDTELDASAGGFGGDYGFEGGFEGGFGRGGYDEGGFGFEGGGFGSFGSEGFDDESLLLGRYVDEQGEAITVIPEDYSFGREFKRLPVRMILEMDAKWLTKLMWELANAPLQVEIEQVRFNPAGTSSRRQNRSGDFMSFDRKPSLGTVYLQGIVYLFNPPDESIVESLEADSDQ